MQIINDYFNFLSLPIPAGKVNQFFRFSIILFWATTQVQGSIISGSELRNSKTKVSNR
jgi:hypothetical protein